MAIAPEVIDAKNVQGIILWGYGQLRRANFLLCSIVDPPLFQKWLRDRLRGPDAALELNPGLPEDHLRITHADHGTSPRTPSLNIAFTAAGLRALLTESPEALGFSDEFIEGMASRALELGDIGDSLPSVMDWHDGPAWGVDVMVMSYGNEQSRPLEKAPPGTVRVALEETEVSGDPNEHPREHFGFTDGIGDPSIRGWQRHQGPVQRDNEVEPGEFLIGYPDQDDVDVVEERFKEAKAIDDAMEMTARRLRSRKEDDEAWLRFRLDGSYLVARKLEQDVPLFLEFIWTNADNIPVDSGSPAEKAITLASKLVGRWPNGASISVARTFQEAKRLTAASRSELDNFDYRADGAGLGCPFGAHVRRSHPRDSQLSQQPLDPATRRRLVNRRRILRRGRTYGKHPFGGLTLEQFLFPAGQKDGIDEAQLLQEIVHFDPNPRGIFFLAFNSDIPQQFEFLQRSWINSPFFAGLSQDPDPITGPGRDGPVSPNFTIPTVSGRQRLQGLRRYVHVRAGGYFFMPSMKSLDILAGKTLPANRIVFGPEPNPVIGPAPGPQPPPTSLEGPVLGSGTLTNP